jgi:hypothetical protein
MIIQTKKTTDRISRRTFLIALGAGLVAASGLSESWLLAQPRPVQIDLGSCLLLGTPTGLISQSLDQGQTWQPLVNFGSSCSVASFSRRNGMIYAQLLISGHAFWLSSSDAKTWRTVS